MKEDEYPIREIPELDLTDSLPRTYQYPLVCKELSFILRGGYNKFPKNLQALVFQDTVAAFRFLPEMQTQSAVSAANLLLQSAEAVLPKQRRTQAIKEFKHAKVAHKRRFKARQEEEGSAQLPQDVLVHMFSFLDMQSLHSVGLVCWLWNSAASDNYLWQLQYAVYFGNSEDFSKMKGCKGGELIEDEEGTNLKEEVAAIMGIDWRDAFKRKYIGTQAKKFTSNRGYCGVCHKIVWLSSMKCPKRHPGLKSGNQQMKPVSPQKIVEYVLDDYLSMTSSSDSDSDSDSEGGLFYRLSRYPSIYD